MNFVVTWTRPALQQFLHLWTTATDPDAIDAAAVRIDQTLSIDAHQQGESRTGPYRILLDRPLAALFVADIDIGVAYVVSVGLSPRTP